MDNNIPKAYILPANPSKIDLDKDEITISFNSWEDKHKAQPIILDNKNDLISFTMTTPKLYKITTRLLHLLEENNISFKIHQEDFYK
jgi:hypothetical protein